MTAIVLCGLLERGCDEVYYRQWIRNQRRPATMARVERPWDRRQQSVAFQTDTLPRVLSLLDNGNTPQASDRSAFSCGQVLAWTSPRMTVDISTALRILTARRLS